MYRILCVVAVALVCLSAVDSFGVGLGERAVCRTAATSKQYTTSVYQLPLSVRTSMSAVGMDVSADQRGNAVPASGGYVKGGKTAFMPARDVLAELDSLDDVLGVDTAESEMEQLKPNQVDINKLAVQAALRKWQIHEKDFGSSPAQVAMLTEKIVYLTKHMQAHPHDFHSRRGLIMMVNRRRKNLNYYYRKEPAKCLRMCKTLGIRFKPKSKIRGREQRYAAFTNTKSKIGNARRTELINREREEQRKITEAKKLAEKEAIKAEKLAKRQASKAAQAV